MSITLTHNIPVIPCFHILELYALERYNIKDFVENAWEESALINIITFFVIIISCDSNCWNHSVTTFLLTNDFELIEVLNQYCFGCIIFPAKLRVSDFYLFKVVVHSFWLLLAEFYCWLAIFFYAQPQTNLQLNLNHYSSVLLSFLNGFTFFVFCLYFITIFGVNQNAVFKFFEYKFYHTCTLC